LKPFGDDDDDGGGVTEAVEDDLNKVMTVESYNYCCLLRSTTTTTKTTTTLLAHKHRDSMNKCAIDLTYSKWTVLERDLLNVQSALMVPLEGTDKAMGLAVTTTKLICVELLVERQIIGLLTWLFDALFH